MKPHWDLDAVIKVGGSLLGWPRLPERLGRVLETRRGERLILIAGGGAAADWIRDLDRNYQLGDERSHMLALHAMRLSAEVLAVLLESSVARADKVDRRFIVVDRIEDLARAWDLGTVPLFDPIEFLVDDDRYPDRLPSSWSVTSDSIAARVAVRLGARELVLIKSISPPLGIDLLQAAEIGLVDPAFPRAAERVPRILVLNLRDEVGEPVTLERA